MKSAELFPVQLNAIDWENTFFRISAVESEGESEEKNLADSIQTVGLIHPPVLLRGKAKFTVICGFRRLNACRDSGLEAIDAMVLPSTLSLSECAQMAIADNVCQRELNWVETANALNLLFRVLPDAHHVCRAAGRLGLPADIHTIEKIKSIIHLPPSIQKGIRSNRISLPVAFELGNLEVAPANCLSEIFMELKLSTNKQREILTQIKDISRRDGISIIDVLEETGLREILGQNLTDRPEMARQLRIYLKKRRFPSIFRKEAAFADYIKSLKLPKTAKLIAPEHFEGPTYTLQLLFKSQRELKGCRRALDKIINHPDTRTIFE